MAALALSLLSANAATLTWDGLGDGTIGSSANWSPLAAPASGDTLIFAGTTGLAPQLTANLSVGSLSFNSTAGAFTIGGAGTFTLASGITDSSTAAETINTALKLGAAQTWSASAGTLTIGGAVADNGFLLTIGGAGATSITAVIAGTGGLTQSATGTVTLSGANTYTGTSTLSAGVTSVGSNAAFGTGGVTLAGGSLQSNAAWTIGNNIALTANSTLGGSQTLTLSGALTESGGNRTLTVNNTASTILTGGLKLSDGKSGRTLTIAGTGNFVVNSVISNGASTRACNLIKSGTGTLTFGGSSANTYTGTTTVSSGTLLLNKTSGNAVPQALSITGTVRLLASDQIADTSAVTINTGGTFDLNGATETVASITGAGTVALGAGTLTVTTGTTFAGTLTGAGGLVKSGTTTLTLTGTANSEGSLLAPAGTIVIGAAGAVSSATTLSTSGTGIVSLGAISTTVGGLNLTGGSIQTTTGTLTVSGGITATSSGGSAATISGKLNLSSVGAFAVSAGGATSDLTVSAQISGTHGLTKTGTGTLLLSATNTYTGPTTISAGTLQLTGSAGLSDTDSVIDNATLILASTNETIGSLAGTGTVSLGSATLTSGGDNSSTAFSGAITGAGGLVKVGTGVLTLSGANTYSGATTISAGSVALAANGALSPSSSLTLANVSGASLNLAGNTATVGSISGGGTLGGNISLGSGTLSAGGSNASTSYAGVISGTGNLVKQGTGTLTLTGASTYTGTTHLTGGTVTLNAGGTLAATSAVALDTGSTLTLDNTSVNSTRLASTTGLTLAGGTFNFLGNAGGSTLSLGALSLTTGNSQIALTQSGAAPVIVNFSSVGGIGGTATVNFAATGGTLGGSATAPQIYVSGLAQGFIGGWATVGTSFAEYSTFGIRALAGYYTGPLGVNVNDPTQIPLLASTSATAEWTLTNAGTTTDKSLNVTDRATVSLGAIATNTLNLASGGLLKSTTTATTISGAGRLTAGGTAAATLAVTVDTVSNLTISAPITNNAGANGIYGDGDDGVVGLSKGGSGMLILSGTNTYSGATTLNGGTLQISAAGNLGTGSVSFSGGTLQVTTGFTDAARAYNIGASMSGSLDVASGQTVSLSTIVTADSAGVFHKIGLGTLLLPNSNAAFTGTLSLDAGTLQLQTANALAGTVSLNGGSLNLKADTATSFLSKLTIAAGAAPSINVGRLAGTGSLTHSLGSLTIGANTLSVTGDGNAGLSIGSVTLAGAATFSPTTANLTLAQVSGAFGFTKAGSGTLTLTGTNSYTGATTVSVGTLAVGAANATSTNSALSLAGGTALNLAGWSTQIASLTGSGNVILGTGTLSTGGDGSSGTYSGAISGTGGLVKTGAGTFTVSGASTYSGATTVNGGAVALGASNALPASAVVVASGALLDLAGFSQNLSSVSGIGTLNIGAGTLTLGTGNPTATFGGILTGAGSLIKLGTGTQSFLGASTFSGAVSIQAGVVNVQSDTALGTGGISVSAGGELQFQASTSIASALNIQGNGATGFGSLHSVSGDNTITGAIALNGDALIGSDPGSLSLEGNVALGSRVLSFTGAGTANLDGIVSGTGSVTKSGAGILTVSNTNTYSGGTSITAGVLQISDPGALGTGSTTVASGSALQINDPVGFTVSGLALTLNGSGDGTGALLNVMGVSTWSGPITLAGDSTIGVTADTLTLSGAIGESGSHSLTKVGAGTLVLAGVNTYTGSTAVSAGTLSITGKLISPSLQIAAGATATLAGNALPSTAALTANGAVTFNGNQSIASISGSISGSLAINGSTLTVASGTFAGSIQDGAAAGALTQSGAGTLTLSSVNTYTGATTIGGKLIAGGAGALGSTSALTITGTLQLAGTGDRVNNAATVALTGGTIASAGLSEVFGALSVTGASTIDFGNSQSTLEFSSVSFLTGASLSLLNWTPGTDHLIFDQDLSGSLGKLTFSGMGAISETNLGSSRYELVAVPEPNCLLLLLCSAGLLAGLQRFPRRRTRK